MVLNKDGNVVIKIQAKPGAKCNNITGNKKYHSTYFMLVNFHYKESYFSSFVKKEKFSLIES